LIHPRDRRTQRARHTCYMLSLCCAKNSFSYSWVSTNSDPGIIDLPVLAWPLRMG